MPWYVVVDKDCSEPSPDERVWTVSKNSNNTGCNTDSGYPGYGLTKAEAEELALSSNAIWNAAIEAAAKIADEGDELTADWIRNLKK